VLGFEAPLVLVVLISALALIGVFCRLRAGRFDLVPACLVCAPVLVAGFQSYGGEGAFRAYLYALPWLAFFAAAACMWTPSGAAHATARFARLSLATFVLGGCLLFAYFAHELSNHVPRDEVQAETWYEQHAPANSTRLQLATNHPSRLTARYPSVGLNDAALLDRHGFAGHLLGSADVPRVQHVADGLKAPVFLVLSRRQEDDARLNGLLPRGSLDGLLRALSRSDAFHLVYRRPTAWVFEYMPRGAGA
jgi:hypothetical protein